ncbi:MAG: hypothetical protein Q3993_08915 [Filifactor alocis]|nr:hypothetical protein [Filifactor alocis]
MNMRIEHVEDRSYDPKTKKGSGLKAMVIKDKDGNSVVALGTASDPEWMDNGSGMYNSDTLQQKETLDFFK